MADEEKKKFKRKPLSRSRRLGSRRRKKAEEEAPEEGAEAAAAEAPAAEDAASAEPDSDATRPIVAPSPTVTTKIPSAPGAGTPDMGGLAPPPAERMAKLKGSVRRFTVDFSKFLFGLGQSAHQSGQAFGHNVVKPFSHALVEAAISLAILFITGVAGLYVGRYLKLTTTKMNTTVVVERQTVQPSQAMDSSFFSEGFDSKDFAKRASLTLANYLDALKAGDYKTAYDQLSSGWQEQLSYSAFESGYKQAKVTRYSMGRSEPIDGTHIRLYAELSVDEADGKKTYQANYLLVLTADGWKLDGGAFQ